VLDVRNLTKRFKERTVLDNINLCVGEGEVFGCLGPNGAGKTTTMRIILGLMEPTSGEALLWNERASENANVRKRVGVLLESDGLYPRLTAYDNLDYFAQLYSVQNREARITRLLEFSGLADRTHDRVGTFSRGMRRKLGLARALLHSPDLLMLDEPSAGLDPEAQKMVRDLIVSLSSESRITVFLSSHDLDEVQRICGRVAILQRGRIRVCDTIKSLQGSGDSARVEILLVDAGRTGEAENLLRMQPGVMDAMREDGRISIRLGAESGMGAAVMALEAQGIGIEEIRRSRRSLEEVYLDVVREENDGE
jgi:ABC-2 type transport system ATP-binding protein